MPTLHNALGQFVHPPAVERFWRSVRKAGPDECWIWVASTRSGYGRLRVGDRTEFAHRYSYQWAHGNTPIPRGLFVCHRCDNRLCCNPSHLFLGTPAENMADMAMKGRTVVVRGTGLPQAKLSDANVQAIRSATVPHRVIATEYGISQSQVSRIKSGKRWAHLGVSLCQH